MVESVDWFLQKHTKRTNSCKEYQFSPPQRLLVLYMHSDCPSPQYRQGGVGKPLVQRPGVKSMNILWRVREALGAAIRCQVYEHSVVCQGSPWRRDKVSSL